MDAQLALQRRLMCPHCDMAMDLAYFGAACELKFLCVAGCKAEYDAVIAIGKTTELPSCGAKRVQTRSN